MAGVKITQLRSQMATGRRYGSFSGKAADTTSGTIWRPTIIPRRR